MTPRFTVPLAILAGLLALLLVEAHEAAQPLGPEDLEEFREWQQAKRAHGRPRHSHEQKPESHRRHSHRHQLTAEDRDGMCTVDEERPRAVMFGPLNLSDYYEEDRAGAANRTKERRHKHHRKEESRAGGSQEERRVRELAPGAGKEDPPPVDKAALMARYIVNQAGWTSVATVSSRKETESYPFVNVISFSDGPLGNGSGVPYMYLTPLDFTAQDINKDSRATLMMSLAQGHYCESKNYDPMDPRCARIVLAGKIKTIKPESPEMSQAKNAVFGRHPWLAHMPPDHKFFFAKLKIGNIAVLDTFGGPKYVTVKDYFHPNSSDALANFDFNLEFEEIQRSIALTKTSPSVLNIQ